MKACFASDNTAGAHPRILEALIQAREAAPGQSWSPAYGADALTERAHGLLRKAFGDGSEPFLLFNGTGANVLAISSLLRPYECVICPESAHLQMDECGALERFSGAKVITVPC